MAAYVNSTTQSLTAGTSTPVTLGWTLTVGNTLVVIVTGRSSSATHTVTATGSTVVQDFIQAPSAGASRMSFNHILSIGSAVNSITVASSASIVKAVTVVEFSGIASVESSPSGQGSNSTTQDGPSMTTTNANDVVVQAVGSAANEGATYASTGPSTASGSSGTWNSIGNIDNSGGNNGSIGHAAAYQIVSSTATYQAEWTVGTGAAYIQGGIALVASGGGGGTTIEPQLALMGMGS